MLIEGRNLAEITRFTVGHARAYFAALTLPGWRAEVAARIVREVSERLRFLVDVGLDYLSLDRAASTLSGGEAQRIRLASQVGSGLTGVMYILDEPSIGLHQRDNERLLRTLKRLRDLGNTVIVVEHDADAIRAADHVVDLGPGAGAHGGLVVAQGTPAEIEADVSSLTGAYLSGREVIPLPAPAQEPAARSMDHDPRRARQQPAQRHGRAAGRAVDLRDRRLRLGQINPGGRHAVPPRGRAAQRRQRRWRRSVR